MNPITKLRALKGGIGHADVGLMLALSRSSVSRMERGLTPIDGPTALLLERIIAEAETAASAQGSDPSPGATDAALNDGAPAPSLSSTEA